MSCLREKLWLWGQNPNTHHGSSGHNYNLPHSNRMTAMEGTVSTEYFKIQADINKYVNESFVQFVTGSLSLDTDWDAYLQRLDRIGLVPYVTITQQAYDSFLANQ